MPRRLRHECVNGVHRHMNMISFCTPTPPPMRDVPPQGHVTRARPRSDPGTLEHLCSTLFPSGDINWMDDNDRYSDDTANWNDAYDNPNHAGPVPEPFAPFRDRSDAMDYQDELVQSPTSAPALEALRGRLTNPLSLWYTPEEPAEAVEVIDLTMDFDRPPAGDGPEIPFDLNDFEIVD